MPASEPEVKEAEIVPPEPNGSTGKKKRGKQESQAIAVRSTPGIEDLMAQAVATNNLDTIERVFALRNQVKAEAAKEAFFAALAEFQSLVPKIRKRKKAYGYFYAPIGDIEAAIRDAMKQCGLSKRWVQEETGDQVTVSCIFTHAEGHSESATIGPVGWDLLERTERMNGLQHRAAVIAYLQRYTLIAAGGLATADDDTDGALIPEEVRKQQPRQPIKQPQQTPTAQKAASAPKVRAELEPAGEGEAIDDATVKGLTKAMENAVLSNADFTKRFPKLSGIEQVRKADARAVMSWIADPQRN